MANGMEATELEKPLGVKLMGVKLTPKSCEDGHIKILWYPSKSERCPFCMSIEDYENRIVILRRKAR